MTRPPAAAHRGDLGVATGDTMSANELEEIRRLQAARRVQQDGMSASDAPEDGPRGKRAQYVDLSLIHI